MYVCVCVRACIQCMLLVSGCIGVWPILVNTFAAYCTTGGSFKTVKSINKSRLFFRPRRNNINVAHCKHEIIIARTYPTQVT